MNVGRGSSVHTNKMAECERRDNDEYYMWDERLKESMDLLQASWKRLPTYGKKVGEKREKNKTRRSKHIEKWRGLYNDEVDDLSKNIKNIVKIYNTLPKSPTDEPDDGGFKRGIASPSSLQRTRLNILASSRIRGNNMNIVDLSDKNRPTKLSEVLSEIYDYEWTDCLDQLGDDDWKEPESIQILLDILMNIYNTCLKWSTENYFESVQRAIDRTYMDSEAESMDTSPGELFLPKDLQKQIKDFRRSRGPKVLPTIQKLVRKKMPELFEGQYSTEVFQQYIQKCTEFSWLAVVQDPPLALNADPGEEFNTGLFREYMKRGPYVEFVVWPALHIEEGGPVLMKGVAQGAKETYDIQW